jgi:hypothetical protein
MDGAGAEVPEHDDEEVRRLLKTLALLAAVLALTSAAQAATGDGLKLATALKANMVRAYKTSSPELAFTKVTCALPNMATTAHCRAHFTITSQRVVGWFNVTATIDRSSGGVRYRTAKPICKDSKTGAPVGC